MEEDRSDELLLGTRGADAAQKWLTDNAKKAGEWYKDASADQAGIGDDMLRLLGGGAKNVGIASQLPGIKQGLQVLGAAGYYGGIVGGKAAEAVGIDPRIGGFAGNVIGELAFGGAVVKAGKVARATKALRVVGADNPIGVGEFLKPGPGATRGFSSGGILEDTLTTIKAGGQKQDALIAEAAQLRKDVLRARPRGTRLSSREAAEEFYGLDGPAAKELGFVFKNKDKSTNPNWGLSPTKLRARQVSKRQRSILEVTDPEVMDRGLDKIKAIQARDLDPHHIIPIHVSQKLKNSMSAAAWKRRIKADAKKGLFHGNHPRNIVGARHSTKTPHKPSDVWHRTGKPEIGQIGYHTLESQVDFTKSIAPYRDLMIQQLKPQRQTRYRQKLAITKNTKLQWDDTAQTAFKQMKAGNLPEARWRKSNIEFTWAPKDLGGKGRGYIDVIKDVAGDDDYFALQKQFFEKIKTLPSGTEWTLEADTAQKYRLYKRMFRGDPRITPGGDTKLLKTRGIDHFVLRIP